MFIITNPALPPLTGTFPGYIGGATVLQKYLTNFISLAFIIGGVVFFFMLIWGGIEYISAGGEKEAVQKATKRITHALIGLAILFSTYAILAVLSTVFGLDLLQFNIPVIS